MDMQICAVCEKKFDFDKKGLGCGDIVVCSTKCAKASAHGRGNSYAIHNKKDDIVDTDADGTEIVDIY